jgi:hypothetical protein
MHNEKVENYIFKQPRTYLTFRLYKVHYPVGVFWKRMFENCQCVYSLERMTYG